jgi:hypothetical protein
VHMLSCSVLVHTSLHKPSLVGVNGHAAASAQRKDRILILSSLCFFNNGARGASMTCLAMMLVLRVLLSGIVARHNEHGRVPHLAPVAFGLDIPTAKASKCSTARATAEPPNPDSLVKRHLLAWTATLATLLVLSSGLGSPPALCFDAPAAARVLSDPSRLSQSLLELTHVVEKKKNVLRRSALCDSSHKPTRQRKLFSSLSSLSKKR